MLDRGARVEQTGVDAGPSRVVCVADGVPQRRGVGLAHAHNLLGVSVAHKVGLLDAVEEGVAHVPVVPLVDRQAPRQRGLVQVDEQAERQGAQRDPFVVEAGRGWDGWGQEGADPGEKKRQVGYAREGGYEGCVGEGGVSDVQRDAEAPEGAGDRDGCGWFRGSLSRWWW